MILILSVVPSLRNGLTSFVHFLGLPLWRTEALLVRPLNALLSPFHSKAALVEENSLLKAKLEEQSLRLLEMENTKRENRELRELIGRSSTERMVVASVLKRPSEVPYDTLLIDAGRSEGISVQNEVFVDGVPIGVVREVFSHSATVLLFSSPGTTRDVLVGDTHTAVTATGRGGGNFEARIPREISVAVGDAVELPGLSAGQLAVIESTYDKPTDSFVTVLFKLPVNLRQLRLVEVRTQGPN